MVLRIPEEYQVGYIALRSLKEEQVQELVSALEEVQPTRRRPGLHSHVASKVKSIERSELDEIMDALISLFGLREELGISTPELVGDISDAIDQSEFVGLPFPNQESREAFEALLTQILHIEFLGLTAKAISLVYEQDHIVHGTPRVMTDIRPVFGSVPEENMSVQGAMVTYTLKLEYHEGAETTELFVALNPRQVDQLIDTLERAKSKAGSLKEWVDRSDIHYIEGQ